MKDNKYIRNLLATISQYLPEIIALRHQLHTYPELGYQEYQTSELVMNTLQQYGYQPKLVLEKSGVVATIDSGRPGKTIALRADLDALPITEQTNLPYTSKNQGLMHACGHDGHTATLLLVAALLMTHREVFSGRVKLIFQSAEEGLGGAKAFIDAGILENPKVDAIYAYHNMPTFPKGQVLLRQGCILSGTHQFRIIIRGQGGHASAPEKTVDSIYIASAIVQLIQSIVSRNLSPFDTGVISITQFHSGSAHNIIPSIAELSLSMRFVSENQMNKMIERLQSIVMQTAKGLGGEAEVVSVGYTPALINDVELTQQFQQVAERFLKKDKVQYLSQPVMASDDFSYYLQKIPGCYWMMGIGEDFSYVHRSDYQFNDNIIADAALMMFLSVVSV